MENTDLKVNNYINILANEQLRGLFTQEEIAKMQIYVVTCVRNDLQNVNVANSSYDRAATMFR